MLAIFGFRKNRNQTLSNQGPESEAEVYGDGCHTVATAPTGFVHAQTQRTQTPFVRYGLEYTTWHPCDALDNNTPRHKGLVHFHFPLYSFTFSAGYLFLVLIGTISSTELHKYSDKYHSKAPSFLC